MSREGSYFGDAAEVPKDTPLCLGQRMVLLRPEQEVIESRFLRFAINSSQVKQQIAALREGSVAERLNVSSIRKLLIPVPPLPVQRAIAHILGALDDKIELNRKTNETLEAMARALFQSWFVDFDPVRAKAAGRAPEGMDEATAKLFPSEFEQSELGEVPKGWRIESIQESADRIAMGPFGSSIKVDTFVGAGIPVISGQHLRGILVEDSEFRYVSTDHADRLARSNVQRGDVVFTHAGTLGQVSLIHDRSQYTRYVISQRQFFLRCNLERMSPFFAVLFFSSPSGQRLLLANATSTGVPSIAQPVSYLRQIKWVVPSRSVLDSFDRIARNVFLRLASNIEESRTLAALRDALLPKLLSGELAIRDAERFVARAV